jgi:preprotein translocase subunit SecY
MLIVWAMTMAFIWFWMGIEGIRFLVIFIVSAISFAIIYLMLSFAGEGSKLFGLKPITDRMPAVTKPEGHVHFRTKMMWLILILVLYFVLTNVMLYGLDQAETIDLFESYRAIMAGAQGSLMHLGIGPIVTASIILQLFAGAKIIKLDLTDDADKALYQGVQKFLVIVMIVVESVPQVYGYLIPSDAFITNMDGVWAGHGNGLAQFIIVAQLCFGSYLVFLMDETVSKWGIGSGISLFIAGGVAQQMFTGTLNWMPLDNTIPISVSNPPPGTLPKTIYFFTSVPASGMTSGRFEQLIIGQPNPIIALLGTLAIFFFVAYVESCRIELPLAHEGARGARGRYPIPLIYASVIPVILISAVLANVSMFSMMFNGGWLENWPILGNNPMVGYYITPPGGGTPILAGGVAWYVSPLNGLRDWLLPLLSDSYLPFAGTENVKSSFQVGIHLLTYLLIMIVGSMAFSKFWIETTNMGPKAVAEQIQGSGMQIPGFRRDPRILERVMERYIPTVTLLSGAIVGALAAFADLLGTVGNSSGTGVLLAVGIMIQTYEAMGKEQLMEMHPALRGFFGGG